MIALRFAGPTSLPAPAELGERVAVLDIGLDPACPDASLAWARALGGRLALWLDHHRHEAWEGLRDDPRFELREAPACALLLTPELLSRFQSGVTDMICHTDLDGVICAALFCLGGRLPYPEALDDAVAADTRRAPLSAHGLWLEQALKASPEEGTQRAAVDWLVRRDGSAEALLAKRAAEYARLWEATQRLCARATRQGCCRVAEATEPIDVTQALLWLQQGGTAGVITRRGTSLVEVGWADSPEPLWKLFGLSGGSPHRLRLEGLPLEHIVQRLTGTASLGGRRFS